MFVSKKKYDEVAQQLVRLKIENLALRKKLDAAVASKPAKKIAKKTVAKKASK